MSGVSYVRESNEIQDRVSLPESSCAIFGAVIGSNSTIGESTSIANATIGSFGQIGNNCQIGLAPQADAPVDSNVNLRVEVGTTVYFGDRVIVHPGSSIGKFCVIEDDVRLGYRVRIGNNSVVKAGVSLPDRITVPPNMIVEKTNSLLKGVGYKISPLNK